MPDNQESPSKELGQEVEDLSLEDRVNEALTLTTIEPIYGRPRFVQAVSKYSDKQLRDLVYDLWLKIEELNKNA